MIYICTYDNMESWSKVTTCEPLAARVSRTEIFRLNWGAKLKMPLNSAPGWVGFQGRNASIIFGWCWE